MSNWDVVHPGDTDIVSQFPANERAARTALVTNFSVNHQGTDGADVGKHSTINLLNAGGDPATVAGQGNIYAKNVTAQSELFWRSTTGAALQLTSTTGINPAALTAVPAASLTGSIADARLSANVPLLNVANVFTGGSLTLANAGAIGIRSGTTGAGINNYISFQDSGAVERAYLGFGIGASSIFSVRNSVAAAELRLSTNSGSITLDGVASSDFARLSINQTFQFNTAGIFQNVFTNTNGGATVQSQAIFSNGTSTTQIGLTGTGYSGALITGGPTGQVSFLYGNNNIPLVLGTNATARLSISGAGDFDFRGGLVTSNNASASEVGYKGIPQNTQNAGYTCVLADASKHILLNTAGTFTIPANASVAYPTGTVLTFVNGTTACTIAITSDTMTLAGTSLTGSRTLAVAGIATAIKITATAWIISGAGLS